MFVVVYKHVTECDHGSDGVGTQSKLDGHAYKHYRVMYITIFLCNVLLFISACWAIKAYVCEPSDTYPLGCSRYLNFTL